MPTATEPDPAAALPEGCDRLLSKENVAATSCGLLCDKQAEARYVPLRRRGRRFFVR